VPAEAENGDTWYDYAIVRVVPHVERGEFVNAGIVLFARTARFLQVRIELDEDRLRAIAPGVDFDEVRSHLAAFDAVAAGAPDGGPIAELSQSERFHWLTSPRSTVIQTSAVHVGRCDDPSRALEDLMATLVR
jgi:hypothetical protein